MNQRTIAVIEDETDIADAVAARLRKEGFRVEVAHDGLFGIELCRSLNPDLVVLDVMLPGIDGLEVCREIQRFRPVPVLMLTARDSESDTVIGLGVGADDYMTKPFSPRELVARVKALLRRVDRRAGESPEVLTFGDIRVDLPRRRVHAKDELVHLTPLEFALLAKLAAARGAVCRRDQLLRDLWGYGEEIPVRTVDTHVASLRRKLGQHVIRTVHGIGYAIGDET